MVTVLNWVSVFWLGNEFIQFFKINIHPVADFMVSHLSSFYGAVVLGIFIIQKRYSEYYLFMIPILQLIYNYQVKHSADIMDVLFSFFGVLFTIYLHCRADYLNPLKDYSVQSKIKK